MRTFSFDGERITVPEAVLPPVNPNPLVSIVLTAYRRSEQLCNTLKSLQGQSYRNTEIIVVEADHDGGRTERISREFGALYCQRLNAADRRTAVTNNIGIRKASGEIVILQCAEIRHEDHDTVARLVAPIITDTSVSTFPYVLDLDKWGNECGWKLHPDSHPNIFITFCQAFAKSAVVGIGGFDERFVNWGLEDNDFNFRLQYSGIKCMYVPVLVAHQWHEPPSLTERTNLQHYYDAKLAAIKAGTEPVLANRGVDWGNPLS